MLLLPKISGSSGFYTGPKSLRVLGPLQKLLLLLIFGSNISLLWVWCHKPYSKANYARFMSIMNIKGMDHTNVQFVIKYFFMKEWVKAPYWFSSCHELHGGKKTIQMLKLWFLSFKKTYFLRLIISLLITHMQSIHEEKKPHKRSFCDTTFFEGCNKYEKAHLFSPRGKEAHRLRSFFNKGKCIIKQTHFKGCS